MQYHNMNIPEEKILVFQELVKQYDGRFIKDPFHSFGCFHVSVDFDHIPMDNVNEFLKKWDLVNLTIVEKVRKINIFKKFINHIKYFCKGD